jgi:hypothetical protein
VRTRTYLTTPPGREPTDATGRVESSDERYVPALDLPTEPRVPGKHRRTLLVVGVVTAVLFVAVVVFRLGAAAQSQDPALSEPTMPQPADEPALDGGDGEGPSLRG